MDRLLLELVEKITPPVNAEIMNGLVISHMKYAEEYLDRVWKSCSKGFPPGVEYLGYERCGYAEEFAYITKPKTNKSSFDIASSDIYLMKYFLAFNGVRLPAIYQHLLFVNGDSTFKLGGAKYHTNIILSDNVITPCHGRIFVRMLRDKLIIERIYHSVMINNVRESSYVLWTLIYRNQDECINTKNVSAAKTTLVHYLLGKYGFDLMFKNFFNYTPIVSNDIIEKSDLIKTDKYVIIETTGMKPRSYKGGKYTPSNIWIAVDREFWTLEMKAFIVGVMYIVDHFPDQISCVEFNTPSKWRILLGKLIFKRDYSAPKFLTLMGGHYSSLDQYVDVVIKEKLQDNNYFVDDFYQLLGVLLKDFSIGIVNTKTTMYGKTLELLYYLFYDITSSIFKFSFNLTKMAVLKPLNEKIIVQQLNKTMKTGLIFKLNSGKDVTRNVNISGDNKYPKLTSTMIEQESTVGGQTSKGFKLDASKHVDTSDCLVGSLLYVSKSVPTPRAHINPWVMYNHRYVIQRNPVFEEVEDRTQKLLDLKSRDDDY